ncbi:MAG: DNA repair protein RecO [Pseudomonadota bacterium]|nr:DNA repair protein RecO [Pseudomonadota bacterium]
MASRAPRSAALAAFVLHRYDWSESSLILDLFTREQGRIAVAAKGAKRPFSQLRSVLLPFQRIQVSLGRHAAGEDPRDIQNLRGAEWTGGASMLTGAALFNGFYLNELLMKLVARHDPHPALFDAYALSVASLGAPDRDDEAGALASLRAFELVLLKEIGLLPDLGVESTTRRPVDAAGRYRLVADAGVVLADAAVDGSIGGAALLALQAALDAADLAALQDAAAHSLAELRPILRAQLHYHLGSDALRTRQVMRDARALDP